MGGRKAVGPWYRAPTAQMQYFGIYWIYMQSGTQISPSFILGPVNPACPSVLGDGVLDYRRPACCCFVFPIVGIVRLVILELLQIGSNIEKNRSPHAI